jgi:uncharacterized protein YgbK (DUF1537 family)
MNQVDNLKHRLFDTDALNATNFSLVAGSNREVTAEQMAEQANRALSQLEAGEYEDAQLD